VECRGNKMNGTKMTEYIFEFRGEIILKLQGPDTEANHQRAIDEAIRQAKNEIDQDWIIDNIAEEYTDYEVEEGGGIMATIYNIVSDCKALENLIKEETDPETGELREISDEEKAVFLEWINEAEEKLESKFNNIFKAFKNKQAEADIAEAERKALKDEYDRLSKRSKARENEANRIKGLFAYALEKLNLKKYKTPLFSIGWQATRETAKEDKGFFDIDKIPVEYLKKELSSTAISEAVKEGKLFKKDGEINRGKLFYLDNGIEKKLEGVSYLGGETLVIR
jgi:hypothetical protein